MVIYSVIVRVLRVLIGGGHLQGVPIDTDVHYWCRQQRDHRCNGKEAVLTGSTAYRRDIEGGLLGRG